MQNKEYILDIRRSGESHQMIEEKKSPRADNLLAEHVIEGGQSVIICLTNILNTITDLSSRDSISTGYFLHADWFTCGTFHEHRF